MGCSVGGGLVGNSSTFTVDYSNISDSLDDVDFKTNFQILFSGAISMKQNFRKVSHDILLGQDAFEINVFLFCAKLNVSLKTPPAFIICASNDPVVSPLNSLKYYEVLLKEKVMVTLHVFSKGGHSIALRNNPKSTNLWTDLCEAWLIELGVLFKTSQ